MMSKFRKRISKSDFSGGNAVVISTGFGHLDDLLDIYDTIFIIGKKPEVKHRNLIYREERRYDVIYDISAIFLDLNMLHELEFLPSVMNKWKPAICVEGNEVIGRDKSQLLYKYHYRAVEQSGIYHVWKRKQ